MNQHPIQPTFLLPLERKGLVALGSSGFSHFGACCWESALNYSREASPSRPVPLRGLSRTYERVYTPSPTTIALQVVGSQKDALATSPLLNLICTTQLA